MGSNVNLEGKNSPMSSSNHLDTKTRRKRKRVLVDTNEENHSTPSPENEYEKLRQERIARNKEMLEKLQLKELGQKPCYNDDYCTTRRPFLSPPCRHRSQT
jgi:hypothetical protein